MSAEPPAPASAPVAPSGARTMLERHGRIGADLLAVDWRQTPLGPPEEWPGNLATAVNIMLGSRFSMWLAWGPELTFFCNDAYRLDTLGAKYPWALGRPASEVWAEIWDELKPRIDSVMSTGQATWDEDLELFLERNGYKEETYHTFSYSPLLDESGAIAGMLCVVAEETERVVSRRQLEALRALAEGTTESRSEAEYFQNVERQLEVNRRSIPWACVYQFDRDGGAELVMCSGIERGHAAAPETITADDPAPAWPIEELKGGQTVEILDLTARFDDLPTGAWETPPERAIVVPLFVEADQAPYGMLVAATNPHHILHPELRRFIALVAGNLAIGVRGARAFRSERDRAENLAELDRAKTDFFTNVSHELRTPLTLVIGPAQDALDDDTHPLDPVQHRRLEAIDHNARRLLRLVNTLLDLARSEHEAGEARFEPVDPVGLTKEISAMFESAILRVGLDFEIDCEPPEDEVYIDPEMWTRILSNLIANAIKFTFDGQIAVRARQAGATWITEVTDTGVGIDPRDQAGLFDRFTRLPETKARTHEGSGVGLALVRDLAARHGGSVRVESAKDEGSTFIVEIPVGSNHLKPDSVLDPAAQSEARQSDYAAGLADQERNWSAAPARPETSERQDDRIYVLVADDNPDMRDYLRDLLDEQYEVAEVGDGNAALERVRERSPDLIISDVMMPGLGGFGLLTELRNNPETLHIPVIMLSARAGVEGVIEGLEAGADDYLVKPFSARELHARIGSVLELDRVRRAKTEIEHQRALLDHAQRIARVGSWQVDRETGSVGVTAETQRILGIDRERIASMSLAELFDKFVPEEHREVAIARATEGAKRGAIDFETPIVDHAGSEKTVHLVGESIPEADRASTPISLRGSIQDVTEQHQLRDALTEAALSRQAVAHERAIADELQRSLLPQRTFTSASLEVATDYRAGVAGTRVGGDWYDVIPLDDSRTALVIGDVMGRGVKAASTMGRMRTAIRSFASLDLPPEQVVESLEILVDDFADDQLVTMIYGVHDARTGCFSFVNAGHLPPILRTPDGRARMLEGPSGPPVVAGLEYGSRRAVEVAVPAQSLIVLYTDGLVERRDRDIDEQIEALRAEVERSGAAFDTAQLPDRIVAAMEVESVADDVAVLVARVSAGAEAAKTAEFEVGEELAAIGQTRREASAVLADWGLAGRVLGDTGLAISELLSNALQHGRAPVVMRLSLLRGELRIEVRDAADELPRIRPIDPQSERGRGMHVVASIARDWGCLPLRKGKTVWCVVEVPGVE
jgi:signal transduction histidine kinase/DNA-binding response OmpR family regulator